MSGLLYETAEWDFSMLDHVYDAVNAIGVGEMGLEIYPNQIEIITSEQMLDAYASNGLPLMYQHWSFGKRFARDETMYRKGWQGLAYEIVINSNPCISYLMEENSATMQTLVISHAAFGHNHFFKNNYLFQQWTDADAILDYLNFAKNYVARCEETYGVEAVESILDAAHALSDQGVFRYARKPQPTAKDRAARRRARQEHKLADWSEVWRTLPAEAREHVYAAEADPDDGVARLALPEENLLYFLEKHSPILADWERELLRIVRVIAQYFYPQRWTKVMNEGCATFVHYSIMSRLHETGQISDGAFLEFLHSHTSVVHQPHYDEPGGARMNPYALGFAMMVDLQRIARDPTDEDRAWFPDIAGQADGLDVLKRAWANFRDESFIRQYLSPRVIRDFRLFKLVDQASKVFYEIDAIHDEQGYRDVRNALAEQYDVGGAVLDLQVTGADLKGDRQLELTHVKHQGMALDAKTRDKTLAHVRRLWGYDVKLQSVAPSAS
ncbi:MAG: SpoVR family protein [Maricaulaceae bacterium]